MSQSLDIIRHILDENLIDAKKATEGYLNDILSILIVTGKQLDFHLRYV